MSGILSRRQREGERKRGRRGLLLKSAAVGQAARGERSAKGGGRRVRQRLLRLLIFIVIYFNVLLCVLQESGDRCAAERRGDGCGVSRGARDERPEVRLAPPELPDRVPKIASLKMSDRIYLSIRMYSPVYLFI